MDDPAVSSAHPVIQVSRTVNLTQAVALGASATIGVGIVLLSGLLRPLAGDQMSLAYLLALLLFMPAALTYARRAGVTPGSVFDLFHTGGAWAFTGGWLLFGGYLALAALLGWGAALYLNLTLTLLDVSLPGAQWMASALILVVALKQLPGTHGWGRWRTILIYLSLWVLLLLVVQVWLIPTPSLTTTTTSSAPNSTGLASAMAFMAASLGGIYLTLGGRDEMRQPSKTLLPALLIPLLLLTGIGALAAAAISRNPGTAASVLTPLVALAGHSILTIPIWCETAILVAGLLLLLTALERTMVGGFRLLGDMTHAGFLPPALQTVHSASGTPLGTLILFAGGAAALAVLGSGLVLAGLAALAFLWVTAFVNAPDIFHSPSRQTQTNLWQLPFHPLFPGLATAVSVFLPLALPPSILVTGVIWLLLGGAGYWLYGRRRHLAIRRRETVFGGATTGPESAYTVLVGVANPVTAPSLIKTGALLARARQGRLLVLQVVMLPEQMPIHHRQNEAESRWHTLSEVVHRVGVEDIVPETLVRLAPSPAAGLLDTAIEEKADLLLLGWTGEPAPGVVDLDPVLDPIIRAAPCEVAVLRGELGDPVDCALVPLASGPYAPAALHLAQTLVAPGEGRVVALKVVSGPLTSMKEDQARESLQATMASLVDNGRVEPHIAQADTVKAGIISAVEECDILLLGAAKKGILDQVFFGGLPVEVATSIPQPTILVKGHEGKRHFRLRRTWETFSALFPTLAVDERVVIYRQMNRAARPNVDFYVMMALAAIIATLGLLQGNTAVIIGAMLVAPLMSPILAMSIGIVQGNWRLLQRAAETTAKGVALAIIVSVAMTLISPLHLPTAEILARTRPTLLDLVVALASGAAAGYALGRKDLSAALPGVAIAAALVPPLGVVGYGAATSQLTVAVGALLLFTTNLIAIVLAAAILFLLLGFRPVRTERHWQLHRGFIVTLLTLLVIIVPLALISRTSFRQLEQQNQVEAILREQITDETGRVIDVSVVLQGEELVVDTTIYTFTILDADQIESIQKRLMVEIDAPVTLRVTMLPATLTESHTKLGPWP